MKNQKSPAEGFIPAEEDQSPIRAVGSYSPCHFTLEDKAINPLDINSGQGIEPDMINGWRPRFKLSGPIPLQFSSAIFDGIAKTQLLKGNLVYVGPRPYNSLQYSRMLSAHDTSYKPSIGMKRASLRWGQFNTAVGLIGAEYKSPLPFLGNSDKSAIQFDSFYQSANLDYAIKRGDKSYQLILRNDSNTRGHNSWFCFKVKSKERTQIQLSIINFKKANSSYGKGMKPFIRRGDGQWGPIQSHLFYSQHKLDVESTKTYYKLSFSVKLEPGCQVELSYCPPYSYSQLRNLIVSLPYTRVDTLGESLSGFQIPVITIGGAGQFSQVVLISARIHPGESNSSYLCEGIMKYLTSEKQEAKMLRQTTLFKIVPMLNPDGVVSGNFRTAFCGKDLNRKFSSGDKKLYPECRLIIELAKQLKRAHGSKFQFFWDLHGHSTKAGFFSYGPQLPPLQDGYYKSRLFTKLLQNNCSFYKPRNSIFTIASYKTSTARAVLLRKLKVPLVFTFQASVGIYSTDGIISPFTTNNWVKIGQDMCKTLQVYCSLFYKARQPNHIKHVSSVSRQMKRRSFVRSYSSRGNYAGIKSLFQEIQKDQKANQMMQENQQERGSDSEDQSSDLDQQQFARLQRKIKQTKTYFQSKKQICCKQDILHLNSKIEKRALRQMKDQVENKIGDRAERLDYIRQNLRQKKTSRQAVRSINSKSIAKSQNEPVRRISVSRQAKSRKPSAPKPKPVEYMSNLLNQRKILTLRNFVFAVNNQ